MGKGIDKIQAFRRSRLEEAAKKAGGKAALGRLLGYKDGAFVGQMLRGDRPVTEDTVAKLEEKPGFRGWFATFGSAVDPMALQAEFTQGLSGPLRAEEPAASYGARIALPTLVTQLASVLEVQDESTREVAAQLLALLARKPRDAVKISQSLQALLSPADESATSTEESSKSQRGEASLDDELGLRIRGGHN